ncbi:MAG: protoporphyrinogen oxidase HemJ [Parvularculales bacterium]
MSAVVTFLENSYVWLKAFHVIAVVFWMAALFYLPRLFVYHAEAGDDAVRGVAFKTMERRLRRGIMTPAMIVAWLLGGLLLVAGGFSVFGEGWFCLKIIFLLGLTGFHGFLARCRRGFERDANRYSPLFYRFVNEVPPLLAIFVIVLAIVRPF